MIPTIASGHSHSNHRFAFNRLCFCPAMPAFLQQSTEYSRLSWGSCDADRCSCQGPQSLSLVQLGQEEQRVPKRLGRFSYRSPFSSVPACTPGAWCLHQGAPMPATGCSYDTTAALAALAWHWRRSNLGRGSTAHQKWGGGVAGSTLRISRSSSGD